MPLGLSKGHRYQGLFASSAVRCVVVATNGSWFSMMSTSAIVLILRLWEFPIKINLFPSILVPESFQLSRVFPCTLILSICQLSWRPNLDMISFEQTSVSTSYKWKLNVGAKQYVIHKHRKSREFAVGEMNWWGFTILTFWRNISYEKHEIVKVSGVSAI